MTFRIGDRVRVEYDATVFQSADNHEWLAVRRDGSHARPAWAHLEDCTAIRAPLQVGDVLTADDPEPPIGTVLRGDGVLTSSAERAADGMWYVPGTTRTFVWPELHSSDRLTVLYVPEVKP